MFQMKKSQHSLDLAQEEYCDFLDLESKVFLQKGESIYVGRELVNETMRSLLRDEAKNFKTTHLYEILNATITNEAANLALIQSSNYDHIQYAKALHHWNHVLKNMIHALSK